MTPRDIRDLFTARRLLVSQNRHARDLSHYADSELIHDAIDQLDLALLCPFPAQAVEHLRTADRLLSNMGCLYHDSARAIQLVSDVYEASPEYQP